MRNFSKTLISMAAVMAVGSAMAAGAMAAMTAEYDGSANITITGTSSHGASQTMLVVAGDSVAQYAAADAAKTDRVIVGKENDTYTASESTIKQIDQIDNVAAGVAAFNKDVVVGTLADGNYKVLVNGVEGTVEEVTFTVNTLVEEPIYPTIIVGDTDLNGKLTGLDATRISRRLADVNRTDYKYTGSLLYKPNGVDTIMVGDTDLNGKLTGLDATRISRRLADVNRTDYKDTGSTVEVLSLPE